MFDKTDDLVDPLEDVLGYQIRRAHTAMMSSLVSDYEQLGVKLSEAIILRFIKHNLGCNQSAIGRALGVKRTNMVPLIAGLEIRGLVNRTAADGRSNALYLTEDGDALRVKLDATSRAHDTRFFGDISPELREAVITLCRDLRRKAAEIAD